MKKIYARLAVLLICSLALVSCARVTPSALASTVPAASPIATQAVTPPAAAAAATASATAPEASPAATPTPVPTPAPTAVPLPVLNALPKSLPNPAKWAASLHLDAEQYPVVDGSTAAQPLAVYMRAKITGESLADSAAQTGFSRTTGDAWDSGADMLITYGEPETTVADDGGNNIGVISKPIGRDALVFVVNAGNPVTGLTEQQIADIYSGAAKDWSEVGGAAGKIEAFRRDEASSGQDLMEKLVMKDAKMIPALGELAWSRENFALENGPAYYDNSSNSIDFSVYYYMRNMCGMKDVKLLSIDGVKPSAATIASGEYPFVSPFYAAIRADEPADSPARKLFDWLTGAEGKRAIKDAGYVPAN